MDIASLIGFLAKAEREAKLQLSRQAIGLDGSEGLFHDLALNDAIMLTDVTRVTYDPAALPYRAWGTLNLPGARQPTAVVTFECDQKQVIGLTVDVTVPEPEATDPRVDQAATLKAAGATDYALRHSLVPLPGTTAKVSYTKTIAGTIEITGTEENVLRMGIAGPADGPVLSLTGIPDKPVVAETLAETLARVRFSGKAVTAPTVPILAKSSSSPSLTDVRLTVRNGTDPDILAATATCVYQRVDGNFGEEELLKARITSLTAHVTTVFLAPAPVGYLSFELAGNLNTPSLPWTAVLDDDCVRLMVETADATPFAGHLPTGFKAAGATIAYNLTTKSLDALIDIKGDWRPIQGIELTGIQARLTKTGRAPLIVELNATAALSTRITAQASVGNDISGGWSIGLYVQNVNPTALNAWLHDMGSEILPSPVTTNGDLHVVARVPRSGSPELSCSYTTEFDLGEVSAELALVVEISKATKIHGNLILETAIDDLRHRMNFELDIKNITANIALCFTWEDPQGVEADAFIKLLGASPADIPEIFKPTLTSVTLVWEKDRGIAFMATTRNLTLALASLNPSVKFRGSGPKRIAEGTMYGITSYIPWGSSIIEPMELTINKSLGAGGYGAVYSARLSDGGLVAVKTALEDPDDEAKTKKHVDALRQEYTNMRTIGRHDHIIKSFGSAEPATVGEQHIPGIILLEIIDYDLTKITLSNFDKYGVLLRLRLMADILEGLAQVHKKGLLHQDLWPRNMFAKMRDGSQVGILGDFGIAKEINTNSPFATHRLGNEVTQVWHTSLLTFLQVTASKSWMKEYEDKMPAAEKDRYSKVRERAYQMLEGDDDAYVTGNSMKDVAEAFQALIRIAQ
ncbi:protein kinase domain-containing protein [Streptomyces wuyuanensis]|uniref:protein kinase domain-containing protein n=1 Tax=Streptomyces wuyuanensis TaxID=1196353 RepID=UPI003441FAFC